jgi:transmembrane sensor
MEKEEFLRLLDSVNNGMATPEEMRFMDAYYRAMQPGGEFEGDAAFWDDLKSGIDRRISKKPRFLRWPAVVAAAAVLVLVSAGIFLVQPAKKVQVAQLHDAAPGHNQATLTLANGKKIILTKGLNGTLAVQGQTSIQANATAITYVGKGGEVAYNTLSTAKGEQSPYPVILGDGTKVWLDAQSTITFPTAFTGNERIVTITGEAYLEVAHNAMHPFKVQVKGQTIEDLGTEFNINAYDDEPTLKTTLVKGKIKIANTILRPGQQANIKDNNIKITDADIAQVTAWKNGYFRFNNADIHTLMRQISRWYDVDIEYNNNSTNNTETYSGIINRKDNLAKMLRILGSGDIHYQINGKKLTLLP